MNRYAIVGTVVVLGLLGLLFTSSWHLKDAEGLGHTLGDRPQAMQQRRFSVPQKSNAESSKEFSESTMQPVRPGGLQNPYALNEQPLPEDLPLESTPRLSSLSRHSNQTSEDSDTTGDEFEHLIVEGIVAIGAPETGVGPYETLHTPEEVHALFQRWEAAAVQTIELQSIAASPGSFLRMELGKHFAPEQDYVVSSRHLNVEESKTAHLLTRTNFTGVVLTLELTAEGDCVVDFRSWPNSLQTQFLLKRFAEQRYMLLREGSPPDRQIFISFTPVSTAELQSIHEQQ